MNGLRQCILVAVLGIFLALAARAAPPQTINYQGYLTNPGGTPVNGAAVMTFKFYDAATGGTLLWTDIQPSVTVANGNFNAVLGSAVPIALPFNVPYWLTVTINADPEMSPRQPLASSPYAFRAGAADTVSSSADITGNLTMVNSTASTGNIMKGANRFIHNFGSNNTFTGENAGNFTMTGSSNTASGSSALSGNTSGSTNTAGGSSALASNTSGNDNTASGRSALQSNTNGSFNTASGRDALFSNTGGQSNTAIGRAALFSNMTGDFNTASGSGALSNNTTGDFNNASGTGALNNNTTGNQNTASGRNALFNNETGNNNIAIGSGAGTNLTTGNNNIAIGNAGVAAESSTIRIGTGVTHTRTFIAGISGVSSSGGVAVLVNASGQLGTTTSSRRFKDNIAAMDAASSALMSLRPVTFHYKTDTNPSGRTLQYGLIAEEVAEVYPGLVAHSADGQIETVMYQFLPPMLLNELQKQQRTIQAQAAELAEQRTRIVELEQTSARTETLERELLNIKTMLGIR